jgi:hypothetical protein
VKRRRPDCITNPDRISTIRSRPTSTARSPGPSTRTIGIGQIVAWWLSPRLIFLEKQAQEAAIAKENERERKRELRRQAEDAGIAKENKLERLKNEIKEATRLLNERVDAWKQAGSPDIQQEALDEAREKANELLAEFRDASRKNTITSIKIGYLRLAYFARKTSIRLGMPWFVFTTITGAVCFTFAVLMALLVTNGLVNIFAFGGLGFLGGFIAPLCLFFLPNNSEARKGIVNLEQQKSEQMEPLEMAKLAYEKAQEEYEKLTRLRQFRMDCENASLKKQQLKEEYQAVCDE